jgi:predicted nucleic acid-binding Zn ribbon protein
MKCKRRFTENKLIAERDNCVCPKCGCKKTTREIAAPPFHFKGGGWTTKINLGKPKSIENKLADGDFKKKG